MHILHHSLEINSTNLHTQPLYQFSLHVSKKDSKRGEYQNQTNTRKRKKHFPLVKEKEIVYSPDENPNGRNNF